MQNTEEVKDPSWHSNLWTNVTEALTPKFIKVGASVVTVALLLIWFLSLGSSIPASAATPQTQAPLEYTEIAPTQEYTEIVAPTKTAHTQRRGKGSKYPAIDTLIESFRYLHTNFEVTEVRDKREKLTFILEDVIDLYITDFKNTYSGRIIDLDSIPTFNDQKDFRTLLQK